MPASRALMVQGMIAGGSDQARRGRWARRIDLDRVRTAGAATRGALGTMPSNAAG